MHTLHTGDDWDKNLDSPPSLQGAEKPSIPTSQRPAGGGVEGLVADAARPRKLGIKAKPKLGAQKTGASQNISDFGGDW